MMNEKFWVLKRKYFHLHIKCWCIYLAIYRIGTITFWGNVGNMRDNRFKLGRSGEIKILGFFITWFLFGEIARRLTLTWTADSERY